jgi:hypothetical protein
MSEESRMSVTNRFPQLPRAVVTQTQELEVDYLQRICEYCNREVSLTTGDVLFGDRWYHGECWGNHRANVQPQTEETSER